MISEKLQKLLDIFDDVNSFQLLTEEEINILKYRLNQRYPGQVVQYRQMSLDMFPNTPLLNKFVKFISYQDRVDSARLSGNNESSIEDRITANTLKDEIIAQLQDIKS